MAVSMLAYAAAWRFAQHFSASKGMVTGQEWLANIGNEMMNQSQVETESLDTIYQQLERQIHIKAPLILPYTWGFTIKYGVGYEQLDLSFIAFIQQY